LQPRFMRFCHIDLDSNGHQIATALSLSLSSTESDLAGNQRGVEGESQSPSKLIYGVFDGRRFDANYQQQEQHQPATASQMPDAAR
jgi:hypothetical protein